MAVNIKTIVDAYATRVNNQDFNIAEDINNLQAALKEIAYATLGQGAFANTQTMSANKTLTNDDRVMQFLNPNTDDRDVILPAVGATNHPFLIVNTNGGSYTLTVKTAGGSEVATLLPGKNSFFVSNGAQWILFADGAEGGGGGGLTNSIAAVTTSDVTGAPGTRHILDVSGMTANRDFNLPTPSAAGQLIAVQLSVGNDTYELIVKRNGTEMTRIFIAGEKLKFVSTGTGAGDWIVTHDGRIPCATLLRRITTDANTTHGAGVHIHAAWNDATINRGNCANLTNVNIKIRRAGYYKISGVYAPAASMADQNYAISTIWKNATVVSGEIAPSDGTRLGAAGARQSSTAGSSLFGGAGVLGKIVSLAAGDTIWYTFATEATNRGLLRSDSGATLTTELTYFQVDEVLSALV